MSSSFSRRRERSVRLAVQPLEERANPATFSYNSLNRTLTVTGADAASFTVTQQANRPVGFIEVSDGVDTTAGHDFKSDRTLPNKAKIVRNLVFHFDTVNSGSVVVDPGVRLGGGITMFGGIQSSTFDTAGTYGGGVFFHGTASADDSIFLRAASQVGGKVDLEMGDGTNIARVMGGYYGSSMTINGLSGNDTVNLLYGGDVRVNGSVTINLGDGTNTLQAAAANTTDPVNIFDVGKDFKYQGGIGDDNIYLRNLDASRASPHDSILRAGGSVKFDLDTNPASTGVNDVELARVTVGSKLTINGGGAADTVRCAGPLTVGGDMTVALKVGDNYFDSNFFAIDNRNRIGKNFKYSGGSGEDQAYLDGTTVGNNVDVNLGNWDGKNDIINTYADGNHQFFKTGTYNAVTAYGSLKVRTGPVVHNLKNPVAGDEGADVIRLHRLYLGHGIDIGMGNGDDTVTLDDSDISGSTKIDLGDGNDFCYLDPVNSDEGGTLPGTVSFGGLVTIKGGKGADEIHVGSNKTNSHVVFGDKVSFEGGDGSDTLSLGNDVSFLVKGNKTTCETGPTVAQLNP